GGGGGRDLGYPRSVQRPDGKVVTVYYFWDGEAGPERHVAATIWDPGEAPPPPPACSRGAAAERGEGPGPALRCEDSASRLHAPAVAPSPPPGNPRRGRANTKGRGVR